VRVLRLPGTARLDRYVLRELVVPFLIGTVAVALMFDANLLIYLGKTFDLATVPPAAIAQYVIAKTPGYLNLTLPVGMALGASLAMSRLARDSEITAIRTAGASIKRCLVPFTLFGLAVAVGDFLLEERVIPVSERFSNKLEREMGALMVTPSFTQNSFLKLDRYQVSIGSAQRSGPEGVDLTDVVLISRPKLDTVEIVTAKHGAYDHGFWSLKGATFRLIQGDDLIQFKKEDVTINERISLTDLFLPPPPEQLPLSELSKAIAAAHREGRNARMLEIQLHDRFSVPAACLIFGFVAPLLAIPYARTGGFAGVLLSVFLVFLYYNAYIISTEIIGRNGWVNPFVASWLTNILFVVLGLFVLRRVE
jgi:lipopolysaccharide export system permease protein